MGTIAQKNLQKKNLTADLHKKYTMYLAAYYNNISIQLEDNGNPKALNYLNKSIGLYRSVKADDEVYSSIVSKGILLSRRKRYKEAISCYFDALRYFEKNREENADGISYVYTNLGVLYGDQDQWRESIKYLKKAAFVIDQKKEKKTVEDELQKFAMYYNIGSAYITLNDYKNGEEYSLARNFYHKPVMSLNWDYKISEKTNLSSVFYGSWGRGGGTGSIGKSPYSSAYKTYDGLLPFDEFVKYNLEV